MILKKGDLIVLEGNKLGKVKFLKSYPSKNIYSFNGKKLIPIDEVCKKIMYVKDKSKKKEKKR